MISVVKAKHVWRHPSPVFGIAISAGPYFLGVHLEDWGVRLMLVAWHLCWDWPWYEWERGK